jgi:hypothetical protein
MLNYLLDLLKKIITTGKSNVENQQKITISKMEKKIQEQISMYEGVIKESNVLLKLYNSMLTYLNPDKKELKKISQRILDVVSIKDYAEQQMKLLKNT